MVALRWSNLGKSFACHHSQVKEIRIFCFSASHVVKSGLLEDDTMSDLLPTHHPQMLR